MLHNMVAMVSGSGNAGQALSSIASIELEERPPSAPREVIEIHEFTFKPDIRGSLICLVTEALIFRLGSYFCKLFV